MSDVAEMTWREYFTRLKAANERQRRAQTEFYRAGAELTKANDDVEAIEAWAVEEEKTNPYTTAKAFGPSDHGSVAKMKTAALAVAGVTSCHVEVNTTRDDHPDLAARTFRPEWMGQAGEALAEAKRRGGDCVVYGTALPFPIHVLVFVAWDVKTGVAVMTGPTHLFEPEHLTPGGRGTLGDEVLDVVEVNLTGDNRERAISKVTAQRGTST